MKKDKIVRKMMSAMGSEQPMTKDLAEETLKGGNAGAWTARSRKALEIYAMAREVGMDATEAHSLWIQKRSEQHQMHKAYDQKPVRERKDNRHPDLYGLNTSGGTRAEATARGGSYAYPPRSARRNGSASCSCSQR